jgi:hypothetical protein
MKHNTKKLIIGLTILTLFFTGGFFIKETSAQTTNTETRTTLETISQLIGLIAQRLSVFSVKDGKVGIGTNNPWEKLVVMGKKGEEARVVVAGFPLHDGWPSAYYVLRDLENNRALDISNVKSGENNRFAIRSWDEETKKSRELMSIHYKAENALVIGENGNAHFGGNIFISQKGNNWWGPFIFFKDPGEKKSWIIGYRGPDAKENKGDLHIESYDGSNYKTRLAIKNDNGNVGIGTMSPTHSLHVNGVARSNQASFATTSDIRLKDVNGDYKNGLNEILGINPVIFSYKKNNPLGLQSDKEFIGVVAQELQEIIPEAVEEAGDGYLTVNNDAVMWAMVNGMKEQQEQIKYLLEENKVLKEKVDYLMSR